MSGSLAASTTPQTTDTPQPKADVEQVFVLPRDSKSLIWPKPAINLDSGYLLFGLVWFPIMFARFLMRMGPIPFWIGIVIGGAAAIIGLRWVRSVWKRNSDKPYAGPLPHGEQGRLRVHAPSDQLSQAAATLDMAPFEPLVLLCLQDFCFGELDEQGLPKRIGNENPLRAIGAAEARHHSTVALGLTGILSFLIAAGAVVTLYRMTTGKWWGTFEIGWTIVSLTGLLAAFAKPSYLRITPGVLDVFIYPPLGIGKPHVERYDLRIASPPSSPTKKPGGLVSLIAHASVAKRSSFGSAWPSPATASAASSSTPRVHPIPPRRSRWMSFSVEARTGLALPPACDL